MLLGRIESFVESTIDDPILKKHCEEGERSSHSSYASISGAVLRDFSDIPGFIKVVSLLSPRYCYNEHIQVFIDSCAELGLLQMRFWTDLKHSPPLSLPHRDPECVFFELRKMIRMRCLSTGIRTKISKRRHESNKTFIDYCRYVDACFDKHSQLIFLRLDFYYKRFNGSDKPTAERAKADLARLLNNRRHNKCFAGWVGYIAKLEYGLQKGVHWHFLVWFEERVRFGAKHVFLARQLGEYWEKLTNGDGAYWNCNDMSDQYARHGRLGIGLIRHSDSALRKNLKLEVIAYLTKISQLLRPNLGDDFNTIQRGQYPKISKGKKRGRPRSLSE